MTAFLSSSELAAKIKPGAKLAVPPDGSGASVGLTKFIIENGAGDLHLICAPIGGLQVDMLVGAGLVSTIETSAVSLGEAGGRRRSPARSSSSDQDHGRDLSGDAHRPRRGAEGRALHSHARPDRQRHLAHAARLDRDREPLRKGRSDRGDTGIRPDVCLFHAPEADRFGNVRVGRRANCSSRLCLGHDARHRRAHRRKIPAERRGGRRRRIALALRQRHRRAEELRLAERPVGRIEQDADEISRYAAAARTQEGFDSYMHSFKQSLAQ